ncbi:outer membrane protein assembly factor BamE [Melaminivora suipulveris]|uniref:Outer membrane protein assembly factor BamE n=1 Tax=Melaminivora suipulveris TaxID=2109913 RepID=A0A2R3QH40_9BURK|nr:outer membrane protein assembly factor BamE [Melaminivora suipulveris]AVO51070.1 outer membrane protein assembly factor BamE [Melaminivora suipulveris]
MPLAAHWLARCGAALLLAAGVAGCAGTANRMVSAITPYKVEVVQGNFISSEQVAALKPGMGRQQVREILGTPLMTSVFHSDRWEYVFTLKRPGVEVQSRRLTVFFKDNVLERTEGDEMPSEAEFVASLSSKVANPKVPQLEATEAQLDRIPARPAPAAPLDAQPPAQPPAMHYPPLEAPRR